MGDRGTQAARDPVAVRWVGDGSELWRVRVDLFAGDDDKERVSGAAEALGVLLTGGGGDAGGGDGASDQGLGVTDPPVVGLLFWVRADEVEEAATTAVATAQRAGASVAVGPELYDVTVIPRRAVVLPHDPTYPSVPD